MGLEDVITAPQSPWQNPYLERLIAIIRREVLEHVIILNEQHLRCVLPSYLRYNHRWRTHLSLILECPHLCPIQRVGQVMAVPEVGGLHHHYERRAAS